MVDLYSGKTITTKADIWVIMSWVIVTSSCHVNVRRFECGPCKVYIASGFIVTPLSMVDDNGDIIGRM